MVETIIDLGSYSSHIRITNKIIDAYHFNPHLLNTFFE